MKINLIEPTRERRREIQQSGITPRVLLRRWAYLLYAFLKLAVGGILAGLAYLFAYGAIIQTRIIGGATAGALGILGFIPLGHLFFAWAFPIRY